MSTKWLNQNIQVEQILEEARCALQWGDYSEQRRVDVFEVWTIREDCEIDHVNCFVEYEEAMARAVLLARFLDAKPASPLTKAVSPITRAVVVWVFRSSEEDSVLEVGIEQRADDDLSSMATE